MKRILIYILAVVLVVVLLILFVKKIVSIRGYNEGKGRLEN